MMAIVLIVWCSLMNEKMDEEEQENECLFIGQIELVVPSFENETSLTDKRLIEQHKKSACFHP